MSNKAQAARINGAKSNGPVTEEGKAISSQNSRKHGLASARVVLPHESEEEYDRLEASIVNRFKPYDEIEQALVHQMASSLWRLRRIDAMEAALFDKAYKNQFELLGPDADPADVQVAAYAEVAESKGLRMLSRHQGQLRRAYEKAWKELELIQEHRSQEAAEESGERVQNEPNLKITPRMIEQYINAPMPHSFRAEESRAAAVGRTL
jgi:hypothetical protein